SRSATTPKVPSVAVAAESVELKTSDDLTLEGELCVPDEAWAAAVLAHPHPQFGGDMRSIVPGALFAALPDSGVAALRFNFRGVGRSEGSHGGGGPERADVVAAVDALFAIAEGLPLVVIGWSFGADVSLAVGEERLAGWIAVAAPLRTTDLVAGADPRPKLLIVPEHDQFRPPDAARDVVAGWTNTRVEVV